MSIIVIKVYTNLFVFKINVEASTSGGPGPICHIVNQKP